MKITDKYMMVGWFGRMLCRFGFHKYGSEETGYGFDGMFDWYCYRRNIETEWICGNIFREPMDDALDRLPEADRKYYQEVIKRGRKT